MKNLIYYKLMFLYFAISGCLKRIRRYQPVKGWTLFYVEILPASIKATKGNFNHARPILLFVNHLGAEHLLYIFNFKKEGTFFSEGKNRKEYYMYLNVHKIEWD